MGLEIIDDVLHMIRDPGAVGGYSAEGARPEPQGSP
jgi:hypothetical protein